MAIFDGSVPPHTLCGRVHRERGEGVRGEAVWEKRKGVLRRGVGGEAVWGVGSMWRRVLLTTMTGRTMMNTSK